MERDREKCIEREWIEKEMTREREKGESQKIVRAKLLVCGK